MFRGSHELNFCDGRSTKDPRTWKKIKEDGIGIGRALLARSPSFHSTPSTCLVLTRGSTWRGVYHGAHGADFQAHKTSFTSSNELEKFLMTIAKKKEKHNRKPFVTVWSAIVS